MIRVVTSYGKHFVGEDRASIVRSMRDDAWMWDDPKREYMEAVRDRIQQQIGITIGVSIDDFIEDLEKAGYLKETQDD